jgi:hypothetical protein
MTYIDVGNPEATFWRKLNSTPNPEFEKVMEGCAVIQAQLAR